MKKMLNKKKGILFWITGLSGSGKTSIAKQIQKSIIKQYGPTILFSGDDIREIFNFKKFSHAERIILSKKFCKFSKFITDQKINLIFAVVAMMHKPRLWNRKNIDNYVEIFIKANIKNIISSKKKKIYHKKNLGDIVGVNIKPEFPKKPDIIINNDFKLSLKDLSNTLLKKINSKI